MSKCPLCASRKGKRPCRLHAAPVCSLCCGTSRAAAACGGCSFFKEAARDYGGLPRFSTQEMDASPDLQQIAFPVEAAVCSLDRARNFTLLDRQAVEILEVLLDIYAFGDAPEAVASRVAALGCEDVLAVVDRELRPFDRPTAARVIATARHVARRRDSGGRQHLEVLQRYCGAFVESGVGLRVLDDGTEAVVGER